MRKLLAITLILALAATTVVLAQPAPRPQGACDGHGFGQQGKHRGMGMQHDTPGMRVILAHGDEIGLTEEQRDKLEDMMVTFQTNHVDLKADLQKAQIQLKALMRDDADEATVMAAIDDVSRLKANMQKARYRNFLQAKEVLSPEQVKKLKDLRKDRMKNCPKQPGDGRRKGGGR